MAQSETVERILDAAEQLFAEKGFAETSLRLITSKAGVNLAAVNYHFGSKKALIQAVFSRFLGPFCVSLEKELDRRQAKPEAQHATLEDLLHLLVSQAMAVKPRSGNDLSIFTIRCWPGRNCARGTRRPPRPDCRRRPRAPFFFLLSLCSGRNSMRRAGSIGRRAVPPRDLSLSAGCSTVCAV